MDDRMEVEDLEEEEEEVVRGRGRRGHPDGGARGRTCRFGRHPSS